MAISSTQEIHCPKCGVLIRKVDMKLLKVKTCPDCGSQQAIYLNYFPPPTMIPLEYEA